MKIIREHYEERLERICHIFEPAGWYQVGASVNGTAIAIDEDLLAWFYIAPGYEDREMGRRLLHWALDLLGAQAWAVVQARESVVRALVESTNTFILESYPDEAPGSTGISAYLVQTH